MEHVSPLVSVKCHKRQTSGNIRYRFYVKNLAPSRMFEREVSQSLFPVALICLPGIPLFR